MRTSTIRPTTNKEVSIISFQIDVPELKILEKISKHQKKSRSSIIRECVTEKVRMWK